jgi:phage tail sheath protein FI
MASFNAVGKAPGVYIQELAVPGPIAGVGTSTAAFVGPARQGPMNKPTFLTNWTQFVNAFGVQDDLGPYIINPPFFGAHAVRGFFDNGGSHCYFVRVGTAARSSLPLEDKNGSDTLVVEARTEGSNGDAITVEVQHTGIVASVDVVREDIKVKSATNNQVIADSAAEAQKLRPGDRIKIDELANHEAADVDHISGDTITLRSVLAHNYTVAATMRIEDLKAGDTRIRVIDTTGIDTGSYVTITHDATTENAVVASVDRANQAISLRSALSKTFPTATTEAKKVTVGTKEFTLIVTPAPAIPLAPQEVYPSLSLDPSHPRYFAVMLASSPTVKVSLVDPPNNSVPPDNLPVVVNPAANLKNGANDDLAHIQTKHFQQGIDTLKNVDDVNILCVPDRTDKDIQSYMIAHCETMQDRFAILDPQRGASPTNGLLTQRNGLQASDGGFAALYYPQVSISNPVADGHILVPPSGHLAGVYARVDDAQGVHKAPANEPIRGVLELERILSDADQGPLNDVGINVIRSFPGTGIRIWGARTISTRTQWRYVNVRRLLLFLEESIQEGTQFAVFEPNDLSLRQKVVRLVTDFLTRAWRDGALFGASPEEAFSVRSDEELNPDDVRALGQLVVEVIVVPTTPAEFIVFRMVSDPTGNVLLEQ